MKALKIAREGEEKDRGWRGRLQAKRARAKMGDEKVPGTFMGL